MPENEKYSEQNRKNSKQIEIKRYERKFHNEEGEYYEKRWVKPERFSQHYERMVMKVRKLFPSHSILVLDIGCGTGRASLIFGKKLSDTIVGVDISKSQLGIFKKKAKQTKAFDKTHLILCDAENLPLRASTFDLVTYWGSLHHLPNIEGSLCEAKRVMKAQGFCSIHEPNKDSIQIPWFLSKFLWALSFHFLSNQHYTRKIETISKYEKKFSLEDLARVIGKTGLSITELKTVWFLSVMPSNLPKAITSPFYSVLNKIDENIEARWHGNKGISVFAICQRT